MTIEPEGARGVTAETWSSRAAFYFVSIGAAVGLGTLWRFPYLAGQYSSAFIVAFVLVCAPITTPVLAAEFMLGRSGAAVPRQQRARSRWHRAGRGADVLAFRLHGHHGCDFGSRVAMVPGLFALMLGLVAYAFATGDLERGVPFVFRSDWSQIVADLLLAAVRS